MNGMPAGGESLGDGCRRTVHEFNVKDSTVDDFLFRQSESVLRAHSRTDYHAPGGNKYILNHHEDQRLIFSDKNATTIQGAAARTYRCFSLRNGLTQRTLMAPSSPQAGD